MKIQVEKRATLTGHRDSIFMLEKADDTCFFSSGSDGMLVMWDIQKPDTGKLVAKVSNSVYAGLYIPEEHKLFIGENFQGIHLIDLNTRKEIASISLGKAPVFDLKGYKDIILCASGDGALMVLNENDLRLKETYCLSKASARKIAVNKASMEIAVGYSDHFIRIFDLNNFILKQTLKAHSNSVFALSYSPDGNHLLSGGRDAHLNVWKVEKSYEPEQSIVAHMFAINDIAYSGSGRFFATCSMDKSLKVWSSKDFRLLKVIDKARYAGHGTSVNRVFWYGDDTLISCSDDRTISIWTIKISENENHTDRN